MRTLVLAAALAAGAVLPLPESPPARPGSVVLVVGDGTGWQQWGLLVAARRAGGETGKTAFHRLADQGIVGAATTFAADTILTDSGAGGTALACGVRTRIGTVGMDAEGRSVLNAREAAAARGMGTGVVTTSSLTDATPACFTSHVADRRRTGEVAGQQVRAEGLRVLLGGGAAHYDADLLGEAKRRGFAVVTDRRALLEGPAPDRLLGLFAPSHLPFAIDRDEPGEAEAPTLAQMTVRGLEVLGKSEKGFFLVVEGGRINHACHAADAGAALGELRELDAAVEVLLRERERRPDLLVVLTADHETGGLSVCARKPETLARLSTQKRSFEAVAAEADGGRPTLAAARAAAPWLPDDAVPLTEPRAEARGPFLAGNRRPFADAASAGAGVAFATDGHTATPVPVVAAGPGAERFAGLRENTGIGAVLLEILSGR